MKNIHVIPTDKSGRVGRFVDTQELILRSVKDIPRGENVNIYITSDEKPKKGEWVLFTVNDITEIVKVTTIINNAFETKQGFGYGLEYCKKIILTTDQDLIKDGIQAIDDEFLEWFVKNPSCNYVGITPNWEFLGDEYRHGGESTLVYYPIITKEETIEEAAERMLPDFKLTKDIFDFVTDLSDTKKEEPKQETLEEAVNNFKKTDVYINEIKQAQERMYSEEEVGELVYNIIGEYAKHYGIMIDGAKLNELFEQFKKK